ncbi:MAG: RHS repeat domain-containing protein [Arenicella sp.]
MGGGYYGDIAGVSYRNTAINNGNGWSWNAAYALPDDIFGTSMQQHGEFVDVNGDGLPDWVQAYRSQADGIKKQTWLNTGSGWLANAAFNALDIIYDYGYSDQRVVKWGDFIDVNGDGLRDWVRSYIDPLYDNEHRNTALNTGKGWFWSGQYQVPFIKRNYDKAFSGYPAEERGQYVDVNRDGLIDYLESYRNRHGIWNINSWINTGSGWLQNNAYNVGWLFNDYYQSEGKSGIRFGEFVDLNGDGSRDWMRTVLNQLDGRINLAGKADQLSSITSTMGIKYKPKFAPLTDSSIYQRNTLDGQTFLPETNSFFVQSSMRVLKSLEIINTLENTKTQKEYQYAGAQYHRRGRGFLGFKYRTIDNTDKDITKHISYRQDFPFIGRVSSIAVSHATGPLSLITSTMDSRDITHANSAKTKFAYITQSLTQEYELNGGAEVRSDYKTFQYDDYGNVTQSYEQRGINPADYQVGVQTVITYKPDTYNNWLISLPETLLVKHAKPNSPDTLRITVNSYDNRGRIITSVREPYGTPDVKLTTEFAYDSSGNTLTETVTGHNGVAVESRSVNTNYDAQYRLPLTVSNALGHVETLTYHPYCSSVASKIDANGLITQFEYDDFCRLTKETRPDQTTKNISYLYSALGNLCADCDGAGVFKTTVQETGQPMLETFYNPRNQPMMTQTQGMLGETVRQLLRYDRFGRLGGETMPYFEGESQFEKVHEYDVLDRKVKTTFPFSVANGGSAAQSTMAYSVENGLRLATSTNVKGQVKKTYTNALAQAVEIVDAHGKSLKFAYDAQGNTVQTTDAMNNITTVDFDVWGRRTALHDMDLGTWTYTYNAFGEVITQTDARNHQITMQYDALGRMKNRTVPLVVGSGTETSTWHYDSGTNAKGQLSSINGVNGYQYAITYDSIGRPQQETYQIKGQSFSQSLTYDSAGRVASKTYPQGLTVNYGYTNGYASSITDASNNQTYWSATKYDALGHLIQEIHGDNIHSNRAYDLAQVTLTSINSYVQVANDPVLPVQSLQYSYDALSNLTQRQNLLQSTDETFAYDNLNRLTSYQHQSSVTQTTTVNYDALGNIIYKSDVGTYRYDTSRPHAVSRVDLPLDANALAQFDVPMQWGSQEKRLTAPQVHGVNYVYDANGNLQQSGDRMAYWTSFNKPYTLQRVLEDGTVARTDYEYGPEFERVYKKAQGNDNTIYVGEDYERIEQQGVVKHRYTLKAGNAAVQITKEQQQTGYTQETLYLMQDHLGSTDVIVNATGTIEQRMAFDPWGMHRAVAGDTTAVNALTTKGFTGHEMDDEVGFINMKARIYDPYLGRFLSPDTIVPDAHDMQAYNRYSYVVNNPLKYTDPTGHEYDDASDLGSVDSMTDSSRNGEDEAQSYADDHYDGDEGWSSDRPVTGSDGAEQEPTSPVGPEQPESVPEPEKKISNRALPSPHANSSVLTDEQINEMIDKVTTPWDIAIGFSVGGVTLNGLFNPKSWYNSVKGLFSKKKNLNADVAANSLEKGDRIKMIVGGIKNIKAKNADDALKQVNQIVDKVEDAYSGVKKVKNPGKTYDGRMYGPRSDSVIRHADGSITAKINKGNLQISVDGKVTLSK